MFAVILGCLLDSLRLSLQCKGTYVGIQIKPLSNLSFMIITFCPHKNACALADIPVVL